MSKFDKLYMLKLHMLCAKKHLLYLYLYPLGWHMLPSHGNAEA